MRLMKRSRRLFLLTAWPLLAAVLTSQPMVAAEGTKVTINSDQVLVIDGKKVFPIGFTMPPPPDVKAPSGKNGIEELHDAGATFLRTGTWGGPWDEATIPQEEKWQEAAARYGMHCMVFLRELDAVEPGNREREALLRKVVTRFRHSPGLGVWKGVDEPEWGKQAIPPMLRARDIIRELDPNHPIVVNHAPRGTVQSLRAYNVTADITGADVYPISYPPGVHSLEANKEISMVGDYTRRMMEVAEGRMPVWMILQISFSGVLKPGKTLRFPTFPEERFMTYEAIICGARGLIFFGGGNVKSLSSEDAPFRWNWRFWNRVLRPVIEEIGEKSPLYPALVAPNSTLPVKVSNADVEYCVREVGDEVFLLACKKGAGTIQVEFTGLPEKIAGGEVLFEPPRRVQLKQGRLKDWFAPFEVHVYRLTK